jgi:hypothetical protein
VVSFVLKIWDWLFLRITFMMLLGTSVGYFSRERWGLGIFLLVTAIWGVGGIGSGLYPRKAKVIREMPNDDEYHNLTKAIFSLSFLFFITVLVLGIFTGVTWWKATLSSVFAGFVVTTLSMVLVVISRFFVGGKTPTTQPITPSVSQSEPSVNINAAPKAPGNILDEMLKGGQAQKAPSAKPFANVLPSSKTIIELPATPIQPDVIILPYNPVTPTDRVQPESPVEQPVNPRMNPLPELCQNFLDQHQGVYRNCLLDQIANSIMGWGELGMDSPYPTTAKALRNRIDGLLINAGKLEKAQERLMQMDVDYLDGETLEGLACYLED